MRALPQPRLDVTEGVVVGVLGPWGSGKTSFVNLTRTHLEGVGVAVLDFNGSFFAKWHQQQLQLSPRIALRPSMPSIGMATNAATESTHER